MVLLSVVKLMSSFWWIVVPITKKGLDHGGCTILSICSIRKCTRRALAAGTKCSKATSLRSPRNFDHQNGLILRRRSPWDAQSTTGVPTRPQLWEANPFEVEHQHGHTGAAPYSHGEAVPQATRKSQHTKSKFLADCHLLPVSCDSSKWGEVLSITLHPSRLTAFAERRKFKPRQNHMMVGD